MAMSRSEHQSPFGKLLRWAFFDRELRSGLSMSFILLLLHRDFVNFLYELRKPKSIILDKKTKNSYLQSLPNSCPMSAYCSPNVCLMSAQRLPNIFPMSHMSAKCFQFLPNVPNICPMLFAFKSRIPSYMCFFQFQDWIGLENVGRGIHVVLVLMEMLFHCLMDAFVLTLFPRAKNEQENCQNF